MKKILFTVFSLLSVSAFSQSWVQQANAPVGRHHPISFSLNGKGYAVTGTLPNNLPTDDVYQYDPVTDAWTTLPSFPGTARSFGIGTAASNGKAYLGFGATTTQYLRDFWSLDANGTWTQLASCDCSGRRHPAMIAIGDRIYVGLGDGATGDLRDWWMYSIPDDNWTQITSLPGPARHHPFMFNAGGEVFAGLGHSGNVIYRDWYKLDTATNTWSAMNLFPGEGRVAGTQFGLNGFGFILSGDGDDHSYMATGEMWRYDPATDSWTALTAHPGQSRWAPGSFVINNEVYFFGGLNRLTTQFPLDLWKFDLQGATTNIDEEALTNTYVYPNPASDLLLWQNDESVTRIKLFNALGQQVIDTPSSSQKIDTYNLQSGLYTIHFFTSDSKLAKSSKVLIQH